MKLWKQRNRRKTKAAALPACLDLADRTWKRQTSRDCWQLSYDPASEVPPLLTALNRLIKRPGTAPLYDWVSVSAQNWDSINKPAICESFDHAFARAKTFALTAGSGDEPGEREGGAGRRGRSAQRNGTGAEVLALIERIKWRSAGPTVRHVKRWGHLSVGA